MATSSIRMNFYKMHEILQGGKNIPARCNSAGFVMVNSQETGQDLLRYLPFSCVFGSEQSLKVKYTDSGRHMGSQRINFGPTSQTVNFTGINNLRYFRVIPKCIYYKV